MLGNDWSDEFGFDLINELYALIPKTQVFHRIKFRNAVQRYVRNPGHNCDYPEANAWIKSGFPKTQTKGIGA